MKKTITNYLVVASMFSLSPLSAQISLVSTAGTTSGGSMSDLTITNFDNTGAITGALNNWLVVSLAAEDFGAIPYNPSVTFNGQSLNVLTTNTESTGSQRSWIFGIANPGAVAGDISITGSAGQNIAVHAFAQSWNGIFGLADTQGFVSTPAAPAGPRNGPAFSTLNNRDTLILANAAVNDGSWTELVGDTRFTGAGSGAANAGSNAGINSTNVYDLLDAGEAGDWGFQVPTTVAGDRHALSAVRFTTIPEPSAVLLLGLGGLGFLARRKRA